MMRTKTLYEKLNEYNQSDYYGFHMPGHKRNAALLPTGLPYGIDITEIDGFDDLHHAEGILKEAQERAARLYGADETRFLVNGSTAGILSAILGSTKKGDRILVARNSHKSVYHAICMNELRPVYLYPEFREEMHLNTELSVSAVRTALMERPDIKAVVIVSPTYDGVISDIGAIAEAAHEKGIPLIVDEAHGAHLGFHPYFDRNSLAKGADVVIHSVHKTLPALTQTALLHVRGKIADRENIFRYLDMLQSSSPSYVLMAGIDECMHLLEERRAELFDPYVRRLEELRGALRPLRHLTLLETEHFDRSKVVIGTERTRLTGREMAEILLEQYHLQMEMSAGTYVIAMTSVADTKEGFERLSRALVEIDASLDAPAGQKESCRSSARCAEVKPTALSEEHSQRENSDLTGQLDYRDVNIRAAFGSLPRNEQVMTIAQAQEVKRDGHVKRVGWQQAEGLVSAEYAYLYPPGSPIIVPGERISKESICLIEAYRSARFSIEGPKEDGTIGVLGPSAVRSAGEETRARRGESTDRRKHQMGKIFYLMGKSSAGKDSIYRELGKRLPKLRKVVPYTTRPIRRGEKNGVSYHFVSGKRLAQLKQEGKIIELREYDTIHGVWSYFTVDDGQINLKKHSYLMIGTLESYEKMCDYYGKENLVPLYIEVEDGERLQRALARERKQKKPKYRELCRRFLADEEDFSEEKLQRLGIERRFENKHMKTCIDKIVEVIVHERI